jgi:hypothetical protein
MLNTGKKTNANVEVEVVLDSREFGLEANVR